MNTSEIPPRDTWKQDLAPYLAVDRRRSLGQIASVVPAYLAIWGLAVLIQPGAPLAIALGLVATVFLSRMYSLFHDLTHNSLFASRRENSRWGHVLGYFLFTPYRWWQRQHAIHHAHSGLRRSTPCHEFHLNHNAQLPAATVNQTRRSRDQRCP